MAIRFLVTEYGQRDAEKWKPERRGDYLIGALRIPKKNYLIGTAGREDYQN